MRNAKRDVCDLKPQIPYWWHKSVLNPDRSADWSTKEYCIKLYNIIIQCCEVQDSQPMWPLIVRIYLVLPWKFWPLCSICLSNVQSFIVKRKQVLGGEIRSKAKFSEDFDQCSFCILTVVPRQPPFKNDMLIYAARMISRFFPQLHHQYGISGRESQTSLLAFPT